MYIPPAFRVDDKEKLLSAIREARLGLLLTNGENGAPPDLTPVPWHVEADNSALTCHVAKANPHAKIPAEGIPASVVFMGPDAYISPNWYAAKALTHKVVPTWNYSIIRVTGRLMPFSDSERLLALLNSLTNRHEAGEPKPWSTADAPPDFLAAHMKGIVGLSLEIESIEGKAKLSQNRPAEDFDGVTAALSQKPDPRDQALARDMLALPR
ncbi:FMN-binding negative transcriptional regulator [Lacibacterium aquatile]|uniref:FMN-binding negative transcriptional regulator n=1 Tax=Lacibacterium aquatile TaxID=1168082 RepID=A0ABW5DQ66_9PROT